MTDPERMQAILDYVKENPNSFSLKLGINGNSRVRHILTERNGISNEFSNLITEHYPFISRDWLLHDKGDMIDLNVDSTPDPGERVKKLSIHINKTPTEIAELTGCNVDELNNVLSDKIKPSMYLLQCLAKLKHKFNTDWILYNKGNMLNVGNQVQLEPLNEFNPEEGSWTIRNDSMFPTYEKGDIIYYKIIDKNGLIEYGRNYLIETSNGFVVRKLFTNDGMVVLKALNPNYQDIMLQNNDIVTLALIVRISRIEI